MFRAFSGQKLLLSYKHTEPKATFGKKRNCFLQYFSLFILGAAVFCFCAADVRALDRRKAATQYIHDVWTANDGLPQDAITSIVQDGDGYIWIGTQEGLARFDGVNFTVFDSRNTEAIKANYIYTVFVDGKGELWIGASDGLLHYLGGGAFEFFGEKNGLPSNSSVKNISEDAAGNLWLGFSIGDKKSVGDGLVKFKDGQGENFTVKDGLSDNQIKKNFFDKAGNLWIAASNGLNLLKDGKFTNYTVADGLSDNLVRTVDGDRAGNLWIGTPNGLNCLRDGRFTVYTTKDGLSSNGIRTVFEDRDGILWIGTDAGLNRMIDGKIQAVKNVAGLETDEIQALFEDTEGSLWIATHANGLHRLRDGKFTVYGSPEGLLGDSLGAIFEDRDGRILIGTNPGGLSILQDGRFTTYSTSDGLMNDKLRMITQDRAGAFWLGTRYGLNRFKDGKFTAYTVKDGLTNESVRSFCESRDGSLWIGTSGGFNKMIDGKFVSIPNSDEFRSKAVVPIYEDRTGRVWLGMDEETSYFKDGAFNTYPAEALKKANVQSIYEDADGTLWFATWGQGLLRLKNEKLTVFTDKDGLFDNTQWSLLEDDAGNLWMGSNRGIFLVSKQELDDFAEGRIEKINSVVYGAADGMRKSENNAGSPSAIKARDGRLWFSTTAGAVVIDPNNIKTNRVPPPVILEKVLIDEKNVALGDASVVPAGAKNIEFRYAGLSFIQPAKVKYKYRLEGFDDDWIDAGTRRAAFYTNLPPGEYEFRVIAANSDGVWNEQGAKFKFRALAPFWRTPLFYALSLLTIAGLAFLFYRQRLSKLERESAAAQQKYSQQLIESQEQERKRIAVELHDGIGQNLIVIKNRALLGLNQPENQETLLTQMREISDSVSVAIKEVRGIARNLHPYQIEYLGLTRALRALAKSASEASGIEFSSEIDELGERLSKEAEVNLYRIVQEASNNIIKHSGAARASVSIKKNNDSLEMTIRDDGKGFAVSASANENRGLGLIGMSERAKILNAEYEINSNQRGTKIKL